MGISLGIVGLGVFGSAYADLYKTHPLVDRIALCDREPAKSDAGEGFSGGRGGSHAYFVNEFGDAVAHDRMPAIIHWEAVRYLAAGVMAHKSALRDDEILSVPDWGDAPS